ncbi:hypothetical protein [Embleya sp. NPDC020630]|uniref:hypothetical protein n=1 Tax=Embleya sp. NPDC020630 TaxID=3363979 RepID=UPI00379DC630
MTTTEPTPSTGPRGQTEPDDRWTRPTFEALPERRRAAVTAAAGALWRAKTHTPAKAWDAALSADWRIHLDAPDEDDYTTVCTPVTGGRTHTAQPRDPEHEYQAVYPLCRTMDRNQRLTHYRITTGELTCRTCIGYREGRAAARARRADAAPCTCCHDTAT